MKQTYPLYASELYYNDEINTKISQTVQHTQAVASKVHAQNLDIDSLSYNVENKQNEWISLNNDLDRQIDEANK